MNQPHTAEPLPPSQAESHSERALAMMRGLHVLPTPKHYAVFFGCAAGQPPQLLKEVESLVAQKQYFTEEILDQLYNTHIGDGHARALQDTAANAKKILADMLASVAQFTGTTQNISQDVANQLDALPDPMSEESIKLMAKTVVDSAMVMMTSSESVAHRLNVAQQEIANLRENLAKATTESEHDFLTGCFNRKAFDKYLLEAMEEAKAGETEMTLIMLDIDHFKAFNDNFGHLIGDEVLKIVAKTLSDVVKGMDTVARFGGEEFAVILPKTPVGGGMIVAEGIRKSIASKELKRKSTGQHYGQITVSLGVASFRVGHDTPQTLIKRADEALYRSKKSGRNRVTQENLSE